MVLKTNPFDRAPGTIPLMRFMLHTTSLIKETMIEGSPAYRLSRINSFKEVEISSLPTQDEQLAELLYKLGIIPIQHLNKHSSNRLDESDSPLKSISSRYITNLWKPLAPNSKVKIADLYASNHSDYLVVGENEPSLKISTSDVNIITAQQALENIRILFTAHKLFYLTNEHQPIEEFVYHIYRFKKLYPAYQQAWTIAAYAQEKNLPSRLYDHLSSLGTRLDFICQAYDKVAYSALKSANYIEQNRQLYHLAFFIMLITGIFDNLAHIIATHYRFKISNTMGIGLRIPIKLRNSKSKTFYELLSDKNHQLSEFLTSEPIQKNINIIYPLRDFLQHREFLSSTILQEISKPPQNFFEISSDCIKQILNSSPKLNFISCFGEISLLSPLLFIEWAQNLMITIVNKVLSSLDWNVYYANLSPEIVSEIKSSHENLQLELWHLLNLPEEPLYF